MGAIDCRGNQSSDIIITHTAGPLVRAPAQVYTFVEIYPEIISTVILPLPLIQEGQMSVSVDSLCTKFWLTT